MGPGAKQLERPIWSALTTGHARFALGTDLARRYRPAISPMAAVRQISDPCLHALSELLTPADVIGLFSAEPVSGGKYLEVVAQKIVDQMVYERDEAVPGRRAFINLTPADVPEMLGLVELTKPGPFARETISLGSYIGIRSQGELIAMAGERMKFDGFTEISAVCSHPNHRGRGHSTSLVKTLMHSILNRGELPFLHVYSDNTRAAALYRKTRLQASAFTYSDGSKAEPRSVKGPPNCAASVLMDGSSVYRRSISTLRLMTTVLVSLK
jgi:ribosomal protein S18 acetylase RimI-like enzyme